VETQFGTTLLQGYFFEALARRFIRLS